MCREVYRILSKSEVMRQRGVHFVEKVVDEYSRNNQFVLECVIIKAIT